MNRKPFKNFYFFDWLWFKSGSQRKRNNIARHFRSLGNIIPSKCKQLPWIIFAAAVEN